MTVWGLKVLHQYIPNGDDMAHTAGEDEEMEYAVHVFALVQTVEHGTRDIANSLSDDPYHRSLAHIVYQWFESHEDAQSHTHETRRLQITVVLQSSETHHRAHDGTRPYKHEQSPSPSAVLSQRRQRQWRVAARNMPVDGSMVPFAQSLFPYASCAQRMIHR